MTFFAGLLILSIVLYEVFIPPCFSRPIQYVTTVLDCTLATCYIVLIMSYLIGFKDGVLVAAFAMAPLCSIVFMYMINHREEQLIKRHFDLGIRFEFEAQYVIYIMLNYYKSNKPLDYCRLVMILYAHYFACERDECFCMEYVRCVERTSGEGMQASESDVLSEEERKRDDGGQPVVGTGDSQRGRVPNGREGRDNYRKDLLQEMIWFYIQEFS